MTVNFPLFLQKGVLLSLDDEEIFHRLLGKVLSHWSIEHFTEIPDFTEAMRQQVSLQDKACDRLTRMLADWREEGASLKESLFEFWSDPAFQGLASLVMVDYRMPHASGVEVLSTQMLQAWRGAKLLLTAHADDRIAVEAFNGSLIDKFVSKQVIADDPRSLDTLVTSVVEAGNDALQRVWASQITHQQQLSLELAKTQLFRIIKENGWTKHAVIGQPFGILGMNAKGRAQWLQIETQESFRELKELLIDESRISDQERESIIRRECLPLLELDIDVEVEKVAIKPAIELGNGGASLLGAVFDIAVNG